MEKENNSLTSAIGKGLGGVGFHIPYQAPLHLQTQKRQESACGFQALLVKVEGAQQNWGEGWEVAGHVVRSKLE